MIPAKTSKKRSRAPSQPEHASASQRISQRIAELDDWRGEMLGRIRAIIQETVPDVVEEWKWRGTPVWSRDGILCTGETYKAVVKMTFAKGASLDDPSGLFNSSLDGNVRRAIDVGEGEKLNVPALKRLLRAAVALNVSSKTAKSPGRAAKAPRKPSASRARTGKRVPASAPAKVTTRSKKTSKRPAR